MPPLNVLFLCTGNSAIDFRRGVDKPAAAPPANSAGSAPAAIRKVRSSAGDRLAAQPAPVRGRAPQPAASRKL